MNHGQQPYQSGIYRFEFHHTFVSILHIPVMKLRRRPKFTVNGGTPKRSFFEN